MKVGILRRANRPDFIFKPVVVFAQHLEVDVFYFSPKDVDLENKTINGYFLQEGTWKKKTTSYPDVIDIHTGNRPLKKWIEYFDNYCTFTTHPVGKKTEVFKKIKEKEWAKELIIPYERTRDFASFQVFLTTHKKIIIKPAGGNQGKNVHKIEQLADGKIEMSSDNANWIFTMAEFQEYYQQNFENKSFMLQKYIHSMTKEGIPYDIRIQVRKDDENKWALVKIYPRIGLGNKITSNIHTGGGVAKIVSFIHMLYPERYQEIMKNLKHLAFQIPREFERLYPYDFDALGIDLGLDEQGDPYLFEINASPGSEFCKAEAAFYRAQYYKYLCKKHKESLNE
ncbi:YheC/YheD family protein [Enterococcus hulanensis]|uniref:YheC/YheD family protein n=1 Tax=Enterococcus TaxID=1350 RepID=UPI000B5A5E84|nr:MULTISPECIES: YheC/YheD family protein [Enterococcus]MBO0411691.1 YheC/YheD family protein [Enterococcus hulanensis]OTO18893.1 hypothetical protein A5875_000223 [Enterococcus sp. 3H8_DIV0648]